MAVPRLSFRCERVATPTLSRTLRINSEIVHQETLLTSLPPTFYTFCSMLGSSLSKDYLQMTALEPLLSYCQIYGSNSCSNSSPVQSYPGLQQPVYWSSLTTGPVSTLSLLGLLADGSSHSTVRWQQQSPGVLLYYTRVRGQMQC